MWFRTTHYRRCGCPTGSCARELTSDALSEENLLTQTAGGSLAGLSAAVSSILSATHFQQVQVASSDAHGTRVGRLILNAKKRDHV